MIYAQAGEPARALVLLEELVNLPNGLTLGALRIEREWDPLRGDRRFAKLLA